MRHDLLCHVRTLLRVLPQIGQSENASAIQRRVETDTIPEWVSTSAYGGEVWAEIAGALAVAETFTKKGTALGHDVRVAQRALEEATILISEMTRPRAA